jgi:deoxyribose-phosphate aldolase
MLRGAWGVQIPNTHHATESLLPMTFSAQELARRIDFTLFAPDATRADIDALCAEAREKSFYAACVNSSRVELARALVEDSDVQVVALVGFPLGASDADAKRYETEIAVDHGTHEIDFVINLGRLKDGDHHYVLREMRDLAEAADERPVKVILETHLLTRDEKILACQLALDSGVQFIATSSDFHAPPVTVEEIQFLRETLGPAFGLKAAGGIRDAQTAQQLITAGATRIGVIAG